MNELMMTLLASMGVVSMVGIVVFAAVKGFGKVGFVKSKMGQLVGEAKKKEEEKQERELNEVRKQNLKLFAYGSVTISKETEAYLKDFAVEYLTVSKQKYGSISEALVAGVLTREEREGLNLLEEEIIELRKMHYSEVAEAMLAQHEIEKKQKALFVEKENKEAEVDKEMAEDKKQGKKEEIDRNESKHYIHFDHEEIGSVHIYNPTTDLVSPNMAITISLNEKDGTMAITEIVTCKDGIEEGLHATYYYPESKKSLDLYKKYVVASDLYNEEVSKVTDIMNRLEKYNELMTSGVLSQDPKTGSFRIDMSNYISKKQVKEEPKEQARKEAEQQVEQEVEKQEVVMVEEPASQYPNKSFV